MPVKISFKKTPPSNEIQTLPDTTPAKTVKELGADNSGPGALIPFIDKISVVLKVPEL